MAIEESLLEQLEGCETNPYDAEVYRHTFGEYLPDRENRSGARWNPRGVSAIYTALERETAIAEGDQVAEVNPFLKGQRRVVHRVHVNLPSVVDLRGEVLETLGVTPERLRSDDPWHCQRVGEAAALLERTGILVPSARAEGTNLVIFPPNPQELVFEVLESEVILEPGT